MKVHISGDSGPSGYGVATRGLVESLLDVEGIQVRYNTHFWGFDEDLVCMTDNTFPDTIFKEKLFKRDLVREEYLVDDVRDIPDREIHGFAEALSKEKFREPENCMIHEFDGVEDVWIGVGGMGMADYAPKEPYTILSTDFNLDIIPRKWEFYVDDVDEIWVPSEWTKQSMINRLGDEYEDKIHALHYGVNMNYSPTEYDCEVCGHNSNNQANPNQMACLRDDKFNFLVVSRFYHIKGLYRTIDAFIEEFRADDDVRLFIKTTSNNHFDFNPVASIRQIIQQKGYRDPPHMGFAMPSMRTQYLYDLMAHCDAFLQFSRAECFGIAQVQAAYCGTPVAYTNWSSQREILNKDISGFHPLDDYKVERTEQETPLFPYEVNDDYPPEAKWAVPSVDAIREKMRELYETDEKELERQGREASEFVKQNYRWEDKIMPRIERIKTAVKGGIKNV